MDIRKYLSNIDIPATDEGQVNSFLASKGQELNNSVLNLWNHYLQSEGNQTPGTVSSFSDDQDQKAEPVENGSNTGKQIPNIPAGDSSPVEITGSKSCDKDNDLTAKTTEAFRKEKSKEDEQNEAFSSQFKNKFITLPNGKVNQPYHFVFNITKTGETAVEDFWFEGLETIGLCYNPETSSITGTPNIAGVQTITLFVKRKGWEEGKAIFDKQLLLTVNHDPRSLWLNQPSDKNDPYWKPESASQFVKVESTGLLIKTERKDIVAASVRGRSHAHEGIFRDDDFGIEYDQNTQWYIMTVADGAGSAKVSRKGSEIACQTVVKVCKSQLESQHKDFEHLIKELNKDKSDANRKKMGDALYGIVGSAVFKAYKNIEEEAVKSGNAVKDYSTTLIVSVCKKFRFGWFVGAFWVGDGGIGIYNKGKRSLKVLGESDSGEFAGQTRFLTMPEITLPTELYRRLRFDIVEEFTALILMSDGITDPKFETDANLSRIGKWDELWEDLSKEVDFKDNNEESGAQLLKWLDFWSPGNHDDRTIAILF